MRLSILIITVFLFFKSGAIAQGLKNLDEKKTFLNAPLGGNIKEVNGAKPNGFPPNSLGYYTYIFDNRKGEHDIKLGNYKVRFIEYFTWGEIIQNIEAEVETDLYESFYETMVSLYGKPTTPGEFIRNPYAKNIAFTDSWSGQKIFVRISFSPAQTNSRAIVNVHYYDKNAAERIRHLRNKEESINKQKLRSDL